MREVVVLGILLVHLGIRSYAQDPAPPPTTETKHSGAPLGQITVGPFIITPTFRIGTLAVDTNVQYQRERRADFLASGGPGLDIGLPFLDHWKLGVQGTSQYFYFHRTRELRRWTGGGMASLEWATTGTRALLSVNTTTDFSRPSFEVDTRVASSQRNFNGLVERDLGRLTLVARATFNRTRLDADQDYRGADLTTALTVDRLMASPEFRYRLTPMTSLLVEGSYDVSRFPKASNRNFHGESVGVGVLTTGLLKGQATVGVRRNTLSSGGASSTQPYFRFNLNESRQLGRRFRLDGSYAHESTISAFAGDGGLPTIEQRSLRVGLGIQLNKRMDLRLSGNRTTLKSGGLVRVILDDGTTGLERRDDVAYVGTADLGFRLGRARVGLYASYTARESLYFADFGIQGLQAGARVEYAPF